MKAFLVIIVSIVQVISYAQKKIHLYDDTAQMRKEILKHIPAGTPIETAKEIMKKNHFKMMTVMRREDPAYSQGFLKTPADYLFFKRIKSGGFLIEKAWAIAIIFKDEKVVAVKNELWLTGP